MGTNWTKVKWEGEAERKCKVGKALKCEIRMPKVLCNLFCDFRDADPRTYHTVRSRVWASRDISDAINWIVYLPKA